MHRPIAALLALFVLLPAALPVFADEEPLPAVPREDVVVLQNGSIWRGRILEDTAVHVVLERGSDKGGFTRVTFKKKDVREIRRGQGAEGPRGGKRPLRDEWFLLRSGGTIVGTRHLEMWSVRTGDEPGYRLEEHRWYLSQGERLPATRTSRVEVVDLRMRPILLSFREVGDASKLEGGPRRYERSISGRVREGVWRGASHAGGVGRKVEVAVGAETRGRLGFRELLLRMPREVRLHDTRVLDPEAERLVQVRAGFASVADGARGHEFHWEEADRRMISFFHADTRPKQEEVAEGVTALPVTREQAQVVAGPPKDGGADVRKGEIRLPEAGLGFALPDPLWTWTPAIPSPTNTGWRVLGRLDTRVFLADVRIEWHPHAPDGETDPARVEGWLVRRLRGSCPDLRVTSVRKPLPALEGAWQMSVAGTLKRENVRTTAVVVDRPRGRVVLLLACPAAAWDQGGPALDRFLASLRLL